MLLIIQRRKSLQRRIRALSADRALLAIRSVKDVQRCRRRHAFHERVEAASIQVFAGVSFVVLRRASVHRDGFPNARRLVRLDASATDLRRQQSANRQRVVSNHFGIHSESWTARQQTICRVLFELLRVTVELCR